MASNPFTELELKIDNLAYMVGELSKKLGSKSKQVDKPLNISQAAKYIDVAKGTLYNFTSRRIIPHFKKGKRLYFYKEDLDRWLKSNRKKSIEEIEAEL